MTQISLQCSPFTPNLLTSAQENPQTAPPAMPRNPDRYAHLSPSSRFSLRFMRRTNMLAIIMAVGGILIKVVYELFN